MLAHRDSLERRYDGPIPGADPAAAAAIPAQRARLFQRLAGEAREQAAALRARIGGTAAPLGPAPATIATGFSRLSRPGNGVAAPLVSAPQTAEPCGSERLITTKARTIWGINSFRRQAQQERGREPAG